MNAKYIAVKPSNMKIRHVLSVCILSIVFHSCKSNTDANTATDVATEVISEENIAEDTPIFSFSFMGCNRVNSGDAVDSIPSTANKYALQRIFKELTVTQDQPELFFFLGDLVLAETTLPNLDSQLKAWESLYKSDAFSSSGIELVAVPGNHEMLYAKKVKTKHHKNGKWKEFPLKGSTDIWLNYMKPYMPSGRVTAPSSDTMDNRLTFAFKRHNVGFIVMNSDTYNPDSPDNPHGLGLEGQVPAQWVTDQVKAYKADASVEHIFVLAHRPYYVDGKTETGHHGLPQGPELWPVFQENHVAALLSAHVHDYQRWQPINDNLGGGTYQIVAGNGGSEGAAPFFGYSTITVMKSGKLEFDSVGFCIGDPYTAAVPENPTISRDKITLTWAKNPMEFAQPYVGCD